MKFRIDVDLTKDKTQKNKRAKKALKKALKAVQKYLEYADIKKEPAQLPKVSKKKVK